MALEDQSAPVRRNRPVRGTDEPAPLDFDRSRRLRRVSIVVLAVLGLTIMAATPAAAAGPTVEQFSFTGVDDGFSDELTEACGFPVTVTVDAHETHLAFDDGTFRALIHYNATVTGPGGTLVLNNNFNEVESSESFRDAGIRFRVSTIDGQTLGMLAGLLIFEFADGTLTIHGLEKFAEGFSFCGALS